jgi:hypothetical protein
MVAVTEGYSHTSLNVVWGNISEVVLPNKSVKSDDIFAFDII